MYLVHIWLPVINDRWLLLPFRHDLPALARLDLSLAWPWLLYGKCFFPGFL
jgi:hypothetical protein